MNFLRLFLCVSVLWVVGFVAPPHSDAALSQAHLTRLAQQGDTESQYKLGEFYLSLCGLPQNTKALYSKYAAHWFYQAARNGHRGSQFELAELFSQGQGVPRDPQQAAFWYHQAAQQGHALSQLRLSALYVKGLGVQKDDAKARYWQRRGATQIRTQFVNTVRSWFGLRRKDVAQEPIHEFQSPALTSRHLTIRVNQKDPKSLYALGILYAEGIGVKQDLPKAIQLLGQAAAAGVPAARKHQAVAVDKMIRQIQAQHKKQRQIH